MSTRRPPSDQPAEPTDEGAPSPGQAPGAENGQPQEDLRGTPRFFEYWNRLDAVNWMGVEFVESADGRALARFEPEKHHRGAGVGGRAVTGATQAYIFDFVTGAAVSSLSHGRMRQVTVQLDCRYHHPAYDTPLTFEAQVQHAGRHVVYVEATCRDANGQACSRANAIYYRFEPRASATPASTDDGTPAEG